VTAPRRGRPAEHLAREGIDLADQQHYVADRAYFIAALGDACYGLARYQDAIGGSAAPCQFSGTAGCGVTKPCA
jgi:hypothetical protein